jgi:hypothetical protein
MRHFTLTNVVGCLLGRNFGGTNRLDASDLRIEDFLMRWCLAPQRFAKMPCVVIGGLAQVRMTDTPVGMPIANPARRQLRRPMRRATTRTS